MPEIATDLAMIAPEEVNANGAELYFASRSGGKFDWWASYAYSTIEDVVEGGTDNAPSGYRKLVSEYFKSLSDSI